MKKDYVSPDIHVMSLEPGCVLMSSTQEESTSAVNFENLINGGDFNW